MKIAIDLIGTEYQSGTKTFNENFFNTIQNLTNKNNDIEYILFITENLKKLYIEKNNKIKLVVKKNLFGNPMLKVIWMQLILPFELLYLRVDRIYSPMNYCPVICKFLKIRVFLCIHTILPWYFYNLMPGSFIKKKFIKHLMEISIRISQDIIFLSYYSKKQLENKLQIKNKNKYIVNLGIDDFYLHNHKDKYLNNIKYQNYILNVSSCSKYHNILNLIKAFSLFNKKHSHYNFYIVTQILDKKYFDQIKIFIKKENLENKIFFFHNISKDYLKTLYKNASLYLFSSYSETFGLTSLEAMTQKIPVLLSETASLVEINSNAANYFNPDDIEEIYKKIDNIIFNTLEREKKILHANNHLKNFSWQKHVEKILNVLNQK